MLLAGASDSDIFERLFLTSVNNAARQMLI